MKIDKERYSPIMVIKAKYLVEKFGGNASLVCDEIINDYMAVPGANKWTTGYWWKCVKELVENQKVLNSLKKEFLNIG